MGYGNFQTGEFDDALNRLNNTKQINEKDPFIGENDHVLMLVSLEPFKHLTHGPSARASFEVLQSTVHPVGSRVTKLWFLTKPSKFASQANDSDRFADFVRNMMGAAPGYNVAPQCAALIRDRVNDQLMRGMIIKARGVNTSKKADKPWVEVYWTPIPQSPDEIKGRRAQVDAKVAANPPPVAAGPQPQQQMQPQYVQQPNNPANYAQPFPPAQPQQQYVQQPQQQQYAPQQPAMMPVVQQPQWPPQVQQPQQPATAQPSAAPGPGGLLSQIPGF